MARSPTGLEIMPTFPTRLFGNSIAAEIFLHLKMRLSYCYLCLRLFFDFLLCLSHPYGHYGELSGTDGGWLGQHVPQLVGQGALL